jgi:hypothetical protein
MSWGRRILIGASLVLVLLIALVLVIGSLSVEQGPATQSMSMTVGERTVTVSGHYKSMTQESLADGVKIVVDGHEILVSGDQLTLDGKTQVLESDQDVEILVDEKGALSVKFVSADSGSSADAAQ